MSLLFALTMLSAAGTLATLITFVCDLYGRPVSTLRKPLRALILAGFATITFGALWAGTTAARESVVLREPAPVVLPQATLTVVAPAPRTTSSAPAPLEAAVVPPTHEVARAPAPVRETTHIRVIDESGAAVPELAAVFRGRTQGSVDATLSRVVKRSPELQDLVTCDLYLRVIMAADSFELTARGGGFDERAAAHQALERLRDTLAAKLDAKKGQP